jgi:formylglycine-generating enzyme required for sulfatase activity
VLRPGALYHRPVPERHRLIFYLGHLDAFDWNQIAAIDLSETRFEPSFDQLFEAGIDPDANGLPTDSASDWPAEDQVRRYIAEARKRLDGLLARASEDMIWTAIEHRLMHAETLAYLIHNLPYSQKSGPCLGPPPFHCVTGPPNMLDIPAGMATLGRQRGTGFGWDNEFEQELRHVPAFRIGQHKITNGEYLHFVHAGAKMPHFWTENNGELRWRGMFSEFPLPLDWPVYVTHREAFEYAAWRGKHLPTEAQFHRAAYGMRNGEEQAYPWGNNDPTAAHGNFDFQFWDPIPVCATPAGNSSFHAWQMVGNGWEWTSTLFHPFEGFREAPNYPGYSKNFFDGKHYVLKGASPRTAARFLRRSFRNWFRPDYPYVYATFRCVED